jgi:predicted small secreted protein
MRKAVASGLLALTLASAATMLAACNTAADFGKDVQSTGQAITNTAGKFKNSN